MSGDLSRVVNDRDAMKSAKVREIVDHAVMLGAAVVPDSQSVWFPTESNVMIWTVDPVEELGEETAGLRCR